jgi:hypothetical protein
MIRFIGWSSNLQSSRGITKNFRSRLSDWVSTVLKGSTSETADKEICGGGGDFDEEGYVIKGTVVRNKPEFYQVLERWLENTRAPTIGPVGKYGGRAWISMDLGGNRMAVLNADTRRAAVQAYVNDVRARGADVPWSILPNQRGRWNKLAFRADGEELPGWYCYLRPHTIGQGQV